MVDASKSGFSRISRPARSLYVGSVADNDGRITWVDVRLVLGESGAEAYVLRCGTDPDEVQPPAGTSSAREHLLLAPLPWVE
jgi:hypothetical protein